MYVKKQSKVLFESYLWEFAVGGRGELVCLSQTYCQLQQEVLPIVWHKTGLI